MTKTKRKTQLLSLVVITLLMAVILTYNPVSVRLMTVGIAVYYKIDPGIFYRLIRTESSFRSFAVSRAQAIGLGQMQEKTADYIHSKHRRGMLFLPLYNLKLSAKYLHYLHARYQGNWSLVLAAYNWGETNVSRRMGKEKIDPDANYRERFRDIPETYAYIGKILVPRKKA